MNRAIHSIRKVTGSNPNGATRMATVAEQTMAKKRRKRPKCTLVNITMRICRRFLVLALPVVIIATHDENDELVKITIGKNHLEMKEVPGPAK